MSPTTLMRWEQSGTGEDGGTVTFFIGTDHEVSVHLDSFPDALRLSNSIVDALSSARTSGRADLAAQVRRVLP